MLELLKFDIDQQKSLSEAFCAKVQEGLSKDDQELLCLPTYISATSDDLNGTVTVIDFGGTNLRVAVVDFVNGNATVTHGPVEKKLDPTVGETSSLEALHKAIAGLVNTLGVTGESSIGYCYSYPASSLKNGDAIGIRMSKDLAIKELIGNKIGEPLLNYLNENCKAQFTGIKVANDTITTLFAGKTLPGYDSYIGLIVGTGTNMATFCDPKSITKPIESWEGPLSINLESGNFVPDCLGKLDKIIDEQSQNAGQQIFEKAVSGLFVGRLLNAAFPDTFDENTDGKKMSYVIDHPSEFNPEHVEFAKEAYRRSAKLVSASIAGLVKSINLPTDKDAKVLLVAEGSLFWSKLEELEDFNKLVNKYLRELLEYMGLGNVHVDIKRVENANLVGAGIAAIA